MSMTLEQAKALRYGDVIHSDGNCKRWRVTGKVKTWKRSPERVKVPIAYGLYSYSYLTERDLGLVHLESECPKMNQ